MLPKVSILIPCFNAERWVGQAIESAISQSYQNTEIIVIDDGSVDRSLEIIQKYSKVIYWETKQNQGGNSARNRLLELSKGEWLQYLDADDYLLPDKIERQVNFLKQFSDIDIVYSPSILEYFEEDFSDIQIQPIPEPHDPWVLLARWFLPQTGSPLWRKQAILDVGGWKPDQPCCQEHELYFRLLKAGKHFAYCSEAGSIYRQWSEETVCKKNQPEVFRQRLKIEDDLEDFLRLNGQLTSERQFAINQARFECARKIWPSNAEWASRIVSRIFESTKGFIPCGDAAPLFYKYAYKLLGFSNAERIASLKRTLWQ